MNLLMIAAYWIAYYFLHSWLVYNPVKSKIMSKTGLSDQKYRLLYVILSIAGLGFILFVLAVHQHKSIFQSGVAKFFGLVLATYGIFIIKEAFRNYHTKAFLGLAEPELESRQPATTGMQQHIRHPLYAGTLLLIAGFFIYMPTWANLISVVISVVYVLIGIKLEERKLVEHFGDAYRNYQRDVPMLIPGLKGRK